MAVDGQHGRDLYAHRFGASGAELDTLLHRLEEYVQQNGWVLTRQNNRHWGSFKVGGRVAFGAGLTRKHRPSLYFKLPPEVAAQLRVDGYPAGRYDYRDQYVEFEVEGGSASFAPFSEALETAYALRCP